MCRRSDYSRRKAVATKVAADRGSIREVGEAKRLRNEERLICRLGPGPLHIGRCTVFDIGEKRQIRSCRYQGHPIAAGFKDGAVNAGNQNGLLGKETQEATPRRGQRGPGGTPAHPFYLPPPPSAPAPNTLF